MESLVQTLAVNAGASFDLWDTSEPTPEPARKASLDSPLVDFGRFKLTGKNSNSNSPNPNRSKEHGGSRTLER